MSYKMSQTISPFCPSKFYGLIVAIIAFTLITLFLLSENSELHKTQAFQSFHSIIPSRWCSFNVDFVEKNLLELDQKDPQLIQYVRARYLTPPSTAPYNLKDINDGKNTDYKDGFSGWVASFFKNKRDGIFIEAGANEGERGSHTLYLERELGWTGMLIECNPQVVPMLKSHHRKAWVASACLAPSSTPGVLNFSNPTNWTYSGTFKKPWNLPVKTDWIFFDVETVPLYTLLAAADMYEIDYFSFDIEGVELAVLEQFPFDLVVFKVLIIEVYFYKEDELKKMDNLLIKNGYHFVKKMQIDRVYVHNSVKHLVPNE